MTSREAGQNGAPDFQNSLVMAAVPIKEEIVENFVFADHQALNKRETSQQRSNSISLETAPATTSPVSSQNPCSPQYQGGEHHIQYMSPFGDRTLCSNSQQDNYTFPTLSSNMISDTERILAESHMGSSTPMGDVAECPEELSPSHADNMNSEVGSSNSAAMKRSHSASKLSANDPLSHRIIEKRRRDRMNNCLADLSRLIPTYYLKKGRGRIEKTEIIEMAIKYMKHLQAHACNQIETCDVTTKQETASKEQDHFQMGYQEATSETLEFLRDSEGLYSGDSLCVRIMNHLNKHCEKIIKNEGYRKLKTNGSMCSSASSSGYHANGSSNGSSSDGNGSCSNLVSECKDGVLTEESAYRSEDPHGSDEREMSFTPIGVEGSDNHMSQGVSVDYFPSPGSGSNASSSGDDNNNRLYKFKSNMKHRFSADAEHSQAKKKRRDSESFGSPRQSAFGHYIPNHDKKQTPWNNADNIISSHSGYANNGTKNITVPIFALSSCGEYYVPLSLDQNLIAPFLDSQKERDPTSILHPVSIYVNFCTPLINPNSLHTHSQGPPFPVPQDSIKPAIDHYVYSSRNPKDERRRHPGHSHINTYSKKDYTYNPDIRTLRTTGGSLEQLHNTTHEGIQQYALDNRSLAGRQGMRDFYSKHPNKGQISWSHNGTPSFIG